MNVPPITRRQRQHATRTLAGIALGVAFSLLCTAAPAADLGPAPLREGAPAQATWSLQGVSRGNAPEVERSPALTDDDLAPVWPVYVLTRSPGSGADAISTSRNSGSMHDRLTPHEPSTTAAYEAALAFSWCHLGGDALASDLLAAIADRAELWRHSPLPRSGNGLALGHTGCLAVGDPNSNDFFLGIEDPQAGWVLYRLVPEVTSAGIAAGATCNVLYLAFTKYARRTHKVAGFLPVACYADWD